jgi:hypothetical protein
MEDRIIMGVKWLAYPELTGKDISMSCASSYRVLINSEPISTSMETYILYVAGKISMSGGTF